jgi:peptidoglycan/LPS O-acetylase OafA/YrhL
MTVVTPPGNATAFKPRHVPALDGLRAIAVLMVLLCHFQLATSHWIWQIFHQGGFGVYLFFVLSGFLITRILLSEKNKPAYFRNFYARRTLRIFPLYYGVLALQFWVLLPIFPTPRILADAHYQGWLWAYGYNILTAVKGHFVFSSDWMWLGHFWSLAVEEQFYVVWPFIVLALGRETLLKLCIGIVALTPILRLAFYAAGANQYWVWMFTICQMDSLALGAMLACLESSGRLNAVVPMAWRVALGVGAILVICSFFYPRSPQATLPLIFYHGAVALFFAAIVALAVCGAFRWLDNRVLREVGQKSYGMYVFHVPLLVLAVSYLHLPSHLRQWASHPYLADMIFFSSMIIITYLVAFISYNAYEKHFLRLKRFFGGDQSRKPKIPHIQNAVVVQDGHCELARDETVVSS